MAKLPIARERLIDEFGPHPYSLPPGGFSAVGEPDRVVETHCCFCGQQCGIKLKVKDEKIVGFEPWEEFPFNQGKLCPKGVKRYMQDEHPDRLKTPLVRAEGRGFAPIGWSEAFDRVAQAIRRVQEAHGADSVAVLGGASLTNEKAYLVGKFARVVLGTANVDYNGRLCMVSAAAASKRSSASIARRTPGATSPRPRSSSSPGRTSPSARPSRRITSGGRGRTARRSSCSTRG
ncbi:molybdopterin oxidoreductase family protein [Polyangium mundeleinium]|uniref:Molybdopterin-dependent oxidoreductase n=1 Tax=Polyangium mundeleinium TaxID=2995306 RepID=A0ABT5ESP0_9BACT|nr:molybdopterin-dependent oxidoreductase [Polyangium mundeleinium]MDC0744845.1 molybdopterin-dependent oxidoreductase [Polyangium mundeleinium]